MLTLLLPDGGVLAVGEAKLCLLAPPGNPLAQEIMSLYQEPDGTRRLLNYLLDNLAGAIKRRECCRCCAAC